MVKSHIDDHNFSFQWLNFNKHFDMALYMTFRLIYDLPGFVEVQVFPLRFGKDSGVTF